MRIDRSGRFQHDRILGDMRWFPGDDLLIDLAGVCTDDRTALLITVAPAHDRSAPNERHPLQDPRRRPSRCQIDTRGAITLPAAARSLCGIPVGSTIVLVAQPVANHLFVWPGDVAVRLLVEHLNTPQRRTSRSRQADGSATECAGAPR